MDLVDVNSEEIYFLTEYNPQEHEEMYRTQLLSLEYFSSVVIKQEVNSPDFAVKNYLEALSPCEKGERLDILENKSDEEVKLLNIKSETFTDVDSIKGADLFYTDRNYNTTEDCRISPKLHFGDNQKSMEKNSLLRYPVEKSYKCNRCQGSFSSQSILDIHSQIDHGGEEPQNQFSTPIDLTMHSQIPGKINCTYPDCQSSFSSARDLVDHLKSHIEKTYSEPQRNNWHCSLCQKSFTTKRWLINHLQVHTGSKPYKCNECGRRYFSKQSLKHHTRSHTEIYKCGMCQKVLSDKSSLKRHQKVHESKIVQPHVCNESDRACVESLNSMENQEIGAEKINFDECQKLFFQKSEAHFGEKSKECVQIILM